MTLGFDGVAVANGGSGMERGRVGAVGGIPIEDGDIRPFKFGGILSNPTEGPCRCGGIGPIVVEMPVGIELSIISSSTDRFDPVRRRRLPLDLVTPPWTGVVEAKVCTNPKGE